MDGYYKGTRQVWRDRLYRAVKRSPIRLQVVARKMSEDDDEGVRWMAADDIGRVGRPNDGWSGELLVRMLDDREALVRNAVIEALSNLRYRPAVARFCERLRQDPDFVVRSSAAEALGELRAEEALGSLAEAVTFDPASPVRGCAAQALGLIGRDEVLEALDTQGSRERDLCVLAEIHGARARLGANGGVGGIILCVREADEQQALHLMGVLEDLLARNTPPGLIAHWGEVFGALSDLAARHAIVRPHVAKVEGMAERQAARS